MTRARALAQRCAEITRSLTGRNASVSYPSTSVDTELWALPIYAIAAQGSEARQVSAAQLRYHMDEEATFIAWLWAVLTRLGHPVQRPAMPTAPGLAADLEAVVSDLRVATRLGSPAADDPVTRAWTHASAITGGSAETPDGTIINLVPTCDLWAWRTRTLPILDASLVWERGGWTSGTRVRTRGLADLLTADGQLAAEVDASPDRAIIARPVWQLDHDRKVVADGAAQRYELYLRALRTGLPDYATTGPVAADDLEPDPDAFPGPVPSDARSRPSSRPTQPHHPTPLGPPSPAAELNEPNSGAEATDVAVSELITTLNRAPARRGHALPRSMANTDDAQRQAAIRRVWQLRDIELGRVGDSTPERVAQRVSSGGFPPPPLPSDSHALALAEWTRLDSRLPVPGTAPWTPPNQELITGQPRLQMLQWLDAMHSCTVRQRQQLDGLRRESTVEDVTGALAREGFVDVTPPSAMCEAGREDSAIRCSDIVSVNVRAGWVCVVNVYQSRPQSLAIYYNVAAVDDELTAVSTSGQNSRRYFDDQRRRTNILGGKMLIQPCSDGTPSVRVALGALRAFAEPVTPWIVDPHVHIGHDSMPRAEQHRIMAGLPEELHSVFGPYLVPRA